MGLKNNLFIIPRRGKLHIVSTSRTLFRQQYLSSASYIVCLWIILTSLGLVRGCLLIGKLMDCPVCTVTQLCEWQWTQSIRQWLSKRNLAFLLRPSRHFQIFNVSFLCFDLFGRMRRRVSLNLGWNVDYHLSKCHCLSLCLLYSNWNSIWSV